MHTAPRHVPQIEVAWAEVAHDGVPLAERLARHDLAAVFRYLKSVGVSWARIGEAVEMTASRISEIARGKRIVTDYRVLYRIAAGLRIPRHLMGLSHTEAPGPAAVTPSGTRGPVDSQELLAAVAGIAVGAIPASVYTLLPDLPWTQAPSVVTAAEVDTVELITTTHRRRDAIAGGGACLASARAYAAWATGLLHADGLTDSLATRLHLALADLHNLVGWLAHDLDDHHTARRHLTQSLVYARTAGALPLLANGYYRLGRVSLHQGHAEQALHLFGLGQLVAQQSGCHPSVAILHTNTAWAYALLGLQTQVADHLVRARDELAQADPQTAPTWTQFALDPADLHGISAVIHTELARHPRLHAHADTALEHAHDAVALRRPCDQRSRIFDQISLAAASILTGDLVTGGRHATTAADLAENGMTSARVTDRLTALWALAAPHHDQPDIAAFGHRITSPAR